MGNILVKCVFVMYPKGKTDTNKTTCLFQKSLSIVEIPELEDNLRK